MRKIILLLLMLFFINLTSASLTDGLMYYDKLDEPSGTVAIDSLNVYNGTITGSPQMNQQGIINKAINFTPTDYITQGPTQAVSEVFTINAWVNVPQLSGVCTFDSCDIFGHGSGTSTGYFLGFYESGGVLVLWMTYGGIANYFSTASISKINTWYMVTYINDGTTFQTWVNGTWKQNITVGNPKAANTRDKIGNSYGAFSGLIDELGRWNRTLSPTEVSDLWNGGAGLTYPFVADTCTCAGAGNNWEIAMSDYCNITEACDLTTGTLSFTGSGYCSIDATIHTTDLGDPGPNGLLKILSNALIWVGGS